MGSLCETVTFFLYKSHVNFTLSGSLPKKLEDKPDTKPFLQTSLSLIDNTLYGYTEFICVINHQNVDKNW